MRDVGRQRGLHRLQHLLRGLDLRRTSTPAGSASSTGPDTSVTSAPSARGGGGDGVALLAGGAVGDVAHGIDRLVRRAGGDQHVAARPVGRVAAAGKRRGLDARRSISGTSASRPTPASPRSAISPTLGPTKAMPSACSVRDVALRSPDATTCAGSSPARPAPACRSPSARRWRDRRHGRRPSRASRSAVAGATTIRSASRDSRMWPISRSSSRSNRSVNTRSLVSAPTDSGVTNCGRRAGHHAAHRVAALAQAADQVEALVGGDAAADDQQDAFRAVGGHLITNSVPAFDRTSAPCSVTRLVRPSVAARPVRSSKITMCMKNTMPGAATTGLSL